MMSGVGVRVLEPQPVLHSRCLACEQRQSPRGAFRVGGEERCETLPGIQSGVEPPSQWLLREQRAACLPDRAAQGLTASREMPCLGLLDAQGHVWFWSRR